MRRMHGVVTGLIVVLGAVHLAITPTVSDGFDASALWFAGSGLFLLAAGLLNLSVARTGGSDPFVTYSTAAIDALGAGMALWAIQTVGGPPPYVLLLLFAAAAVLTIVQRRTAA